MEVSVFFFQRGGARLSVAQRQIMWCHIAIPVGPWESSDPQSRAGLVQQAETRNHDNAKKRVGKFWTVRRNRKILTYEVLTRKPPRGFFADRRLEGVAARELRLDEGRSSAAVNDAVVGDTESSTSS